MEAEIAGVAARLRGVYAEKLFEWRGQYGSTTNGAIPKRGARVFAPLFHSRMQPELGVRPSSSHDVDWKALLHSVFRRYAGELVVQGRLLNQDELEVHRFALLQEHKPILRNASDASVVIVLPTAGMRFIVRCEDAPASRIGDEVTARVVKTHARVLSMLSSSAPVVSYRSDQSAEAAVWADMTVATQDLLAMDSVLGFAVNQFKTTINSQRRHTNASVSRRSRTGQGEGDGDQEEDEDYGEDYEHDCANHTIVRDSTFSDLRGVNRMMDANHISPMQWTTLLTPSRADSVESDKLEHDAWSFVSLGNAQKTMWSQERVTRGDALRAKARFKDALVEYTSAVRLDDANTDALVKRGNTLLELRQYDDAIRDFESVAVMDPTHTAALHGLLRAKGKLGHSKHVVVKEQAPTRSRSRSRDDVKRSGAERREGNRSRERVHADEQDDAASVLENDRLRRLLEEDERQRKQSRRKSRSRRDHSSDSDSGSSTDSDTSDSKHSRRKHSKSRKKSKKKKKTKTKKHDRKKHRTHSSRSRDDDRKHSKRSRSYHSSAASSSDSEQGERRHKRRSHRARSRSHSRSRSRSRRRGGERASRSGSIIAKQDPQNDDELHPIMVHNPHPLGN